MIRDYHWRDKILRLDSAEWHTHQNILAGDEYSIGPLIEANATLDVVIDVGANIGAFAVMVATYWPEATVYAIEPHPETFSLLEHNAAQCGNIVPIHAAITARRCDVSLTNEPQSTGNRVGEIWHALDNRADILGLRVPGLSIMDVIDDYDITRCDLLKCDCEGGEYVLFEQLANAGWLNNVGWIRGEWHHRLSNKRLRAALRKTHRLSIDNNMPHDVGPFIAHRRS